MNISTIVQIRAESSFDKHLNTIYSIVILIDWLFILMGRFKWPGFSALLINWVTASPTYTFYNTGT